MSYEQLYVTGSQVQEEADPEKVSPPEEARQSRRGSNFKLSQQPSPPT